MKRTHQIVVQGVSFKRPEFRICHQQIVGIGVDALDFIELKTGQIDAGQRMLHIPEIRMLDHSGERPRAGIR